MATPSALVAEQYNDERFSIDWIDSLAGLLVGVLGGALGSIPLGSSLSHSLLIGGIFGLIFAVFFRQRANTPGAGLIWGLGCSLLLWILIPAGIRPMLQGQRHSMAMLSNAQNQFPELVAYLVLLGMPVGLTLGIRGALRSQKEKRLFRWGRAIVAGGFAGTLSGLVFGRWMYEGEFYPLLGGIGNLSSQSITIALQFLIALLIGATFGLLFQLDIRGLGSSMGWGLGFGIFWWFLGPLTLFPLASGRL
jgi:uncharacterized membrane protein